MVNLAALAGDFLGNEDDHGKRRHTLR